ncbi:MAG TPA: tetratricopeptide repeat protein [Thermoanaerobaculia bacterium]|nr:tetratricopeptide repeat protein [Thermoanaerobaculia bacterium]
MLMIVAALIVGGDARAATTETDRWRADLLVVATEVPRAHKSAFHTVTRTDFEAAVTRLDGRIPSLTRNQIIVELGRIVASIGDGHTRIGWPTFDANGYGGMGRDYLDADPAIGFRQYPLRLYAFDDGLHVIAASEEHASIVGGRVVQVGSAGVDAALAAVSEIVFHDNAMSRLHRAAIALTVPEILLAFGWTDREQACFVIEKGGARHTIEVQPVPSDTTIRWIDAAAGSQNPKPLWLRQPENNYWFEYVADERLLYFQYNAVRNKNEETLADFFKRLFAFVAAHPIDKFVIDLRNDDLAAMLTRAYEIGGLDAAMRELHDFTGRVASRYGDFETDIRTFGQMLMRRERYTDAVVVFRVNAERYPSSLSAPLYLGLAARVAGDVKLAIASFRRALELNPVNSFAAQALKELLAR